MTKSFAGVAILLAAAWSAAGPAAAQSEGTRLIQGAYTTPEISRRCQDYVNARIPASDTGDSRRQSVFLACVRKLSRDEGVRPGSTAAAAAATGAAIATAPVAAAAAPAPAGPAYGPPPSEQYLVSAPVSLDTSGAPYLWSSVVSPFECSTDEGFGRRLQCGPGTGQ